MRTSILLVLAAAALVLDPISACIGGPSFTFGDREMRAAIEGTWQLTVQPPTGDAQSYTLEISQATKAEHAARGWIHSAAACGSRSFVRNAAACLDTTHMPLDVRLAAGPAAVTKGELLVVGERFERGELRLTVGSHAMEVMITPKGAVERLDAYTPNGVDPSTIQLARVAAK